MKFFVKDMGIETGSVSIATLTKKDANLLDLHKGDRIKIKFHHEETVAVLDFADEKAVPCGKIGLFFEVIKKLDCAEGDFVEIFLEDKPESIKFIQKKLSGFELEDSEIKKIIEDVVENKLTDVEIAFFVAAGYLKSFTMKEVVALTKSMVETGDILKINKNKIIDFHCIGGVPGNRTTMIVVPILACADLFVPKTSSRAITSPAGTADTMEVLCNVSLSKNEIKQIVEKTGGCISWGGAMNLAPADERIITIEHPLSIDAEGQMIASIMAKKASVCATHLVIDIPIGKFAKIKTVKDAKKLGDKFKSVGKMLKIKTEVVVTDGSAPVGNGIGPLLEARDVLWVFEQDLARPIDLEERSVELAGKILDFCGTTKKGEGIKFAKKVLKSKAGLKKFHEIVYAQGGAIIRGDELVPANYTYDFLAKKNGKISFNNPKLARLARLAGAPNDIDAGIYLFKHKGDTVKKWDKIFTIYAASKEKLNYCVEHLEKFDGVIIS